MDKEEFEKRKGIVNKLDTYQRNISLKTEINLFLDGTIDEEIFSKIIEKNIDKNEQAKLDRMFSLVQGLKKFPNDISNLKAMFDYRALRIEQGYCAFMICEDENPKSKVSLSTLDRDYFDSRIRELDRKRGDVHDKAIANFHGLMRDITSSGYSFGYNIPFDESGKYVRKTMDQNIRKEITDWMFQLFEDIESVDIEKLRNMFTIIDEKKESNQKLTEEDINKFVDIRKSINKQEKDLGGKIKEDDGNFIPY